MPFHGIVHDFAEGVLDQGPTISPFVKAPLHSTSANHRNPHSHIDYFLAFFQSDLTAMNNLCHDDVLYDTLCPPNQTLVVDHELLADPNFRQFLVCNLSQPGICSSMHLPNVCPPYSIEETCCTQTSGIPFSFGNCGITDSKTPSPTTIAPWQALRSEEFFPPPIPPTPTLSWTASLEDGASDHDIMHYNFSAVKPFQFPLGEFAHDPLLGHRQFPVPYLQHLSLDARDCSPAASICLQPKSCGLSCTACSRRWAETKTCCKECLECPIDPIVQAEFRKVRQPKACALAMTFPDFTQHDVQPQYQHDHIEARAHLSDCGGVSRLPKANSKTSEPAMDLNDQMKMILLDQKAERASTRLQRQLSTMSSMTPLIHLPLPYLGKAPFSKKVELQPCGKMNEKRQLRWDSEMENLFLRVMVRLGNSGELSVVPGFRATLFVRPHTRSHFFPLATPSAVLCQMKVAGLTRPQVATHMQKHRIRVKKQQRIEAERKIAALSGLLPPPRRGTGAA